ncbi:hypothetical protein [Photobacterium leiognathi]|uniref:hypothetical protein n=1 Tax=Photobacterium leiognathi TaxID=553611 RepID=UPI0029821585|nr:hypothetical protein [Photobacterium leiognathi]
MKNNDNLGNILRSQAPFDEGLHSFLLRTMWKYDPTITPIGVIKKSGGFINHPFCHKSIEHLFKLYPDHILLEKIDINKRINGINNSLFDCPSYYAERIKYIFFPNRNKTAPRQEHKSIRYCLDCINKGIKSFGYGYFRYFWEIDNKCLIHHSILKTIPVNNIKNTIASIKLLMKGIEPKGVSEVKEKKSEYKYPVDYEKLFNENFLFPIKFADCLIDSFAIWIFTNKNSFKSSILRDTRLKLSDEYFDLKYEDKNKNDILLKKYFMHFHFLCSAEEPDILSDFYFNHVDFLKLYLGPKKEGVMKEIYSKSKTHNCNSCNLQHCTIKKGTINKPLSREKVTFEFLLNNSYTLCRIAMQGRSINIIGKEPWAPIDVSINSQIYLDTN